MGACLSFHLEVFANLAAFKIVIIRSRLNQDIVGSSQRFNSLNLDYKEIILPAIDCIRDPLIPSHLASILATGLRLCWSPSQITSGNIWIRVGQHCYYCLISQQHLTQSTIHCWPTALPTLKCRGQPFSGCCLSSRVRDRG